MREVKIPLDKLGIQRGVKFIGYPVILTSKGKLNGLTGKLKRHAFKDIWHVELDQPYAGSTFKSVQQKNIEVIVNI